jgi:hypothetical protein
MIEHNNLGALRRAISEGLDLTMEIVSVAPGGWVEKGPLLVYAANRRTNPNPEFVRLVLENIDVSGYRHHLRIRRAGR